MSVSVRLPPLEEIARRWHEIEPMLRRAMARTGCYEPIDILRLVMAGNTGWAVWLITETDALLAVVVTHIEQFPRKRVCDVAFIAGHSLRQWHEPLVRELDAYALAAGCACLFGQDRRGWSRFGFEERGSIMVRDL